MDTYILFIHMNYLKLKIIYGYYNNIWIHKIKIIYGYYNNTWIHTHFINYVCV